MITFEKLERNLSALQERLPAKPTVRTADYPVNLAEALYKYANKRTVNLLGINVYNYNAEGWPVPLYVDPSDIRVGFHNNLYNRVSRYRSIKAFKKISPQKKFKKVTFWNIKLEPWTWIGIPGQRKIHHKYSIDESVTEIFEANLKYIQHRLNAHRYLTGKQIILKEIFSSYRRKNWASCIYALFPLLDSVARQVLQTDNLKKDMQSICKLFAQAGIGAEETDILMAHTNAVMVWDKVRTNVLSKEEGEALTKKGYSYQLNLIGPCLSSFLYFSNRYYGYFKADSGSGDPLNRHAIIHGSYNNFATKANAVRLFTYLYLILELDPVLQIILEE